MGKIKFKKFKNTVLQVSFKGEYFSRKYVMQVFLILTCLPLVAALRSPHFNLHDFSEKTKPFYCPSGANFTTKSENMRQTAKSDCSVNSSCWTTSNGCSASIFSTLYNKQFEVVIINLYSSEQEVNL